MGLIDLHAICSSNMIFGISKFKRTFSSSAFKSQLLMRSVFFFCARHKSRCNSDTWHETNRFFSTTNGESAFCTHVCLLRMMISWRSLYSSIDEKTHKSGVSRLTHSIIQRHRGPSFLCKWHEFNLVKDIIRRVNSLFKSIYFHINNGLLEFLF